MPDDGPLIPDTGRRSADLGSATYNERSRTLRVVWSSGAGVPRRDARGPFIEVLSLDPAHVDLSGLSGAPLLDGHNTTSTRATLGIVTEAWVEDGRGHAVLRFSAAPDVEPIVDRVRDGTVRSVSVGYVVSAWSESTDAQGRRVKTATRWRPHEISLVSIGADPGATVRSQDMPDGTTTTEPETQNRAEVNQSIRSLATRHNLGTAWADAQIDAGAEIEAARAAALAELDRRADAAPRIRAHVGESHDAPDATFTRCADALTHRMGALAELPEPARQYRGLGFAGMARVMLAARGERVVPMSDEAVLTRAMTTGDLPQLLTGTGNRALLASYESARSPVLDLFRRTEGRDFRTLHRLRLGELSLLDEVPQSGEVKHGGIGESAESFAIKSYAKLFALTRQAIVNDDLNAFGQMMQMQGRQAAETLNNAAVGLLTQGGGLGPIMSDGQRMFHATHGNVATTPAAPGESAFAAGLAAMRGQRGLDGVSPINVVPRHLVVSPEFEVDASHALAEIFPVSGENVNSLGRTLTLMVEPRLSGERWYLFADPASFANFEVAFLSSAPAPQMESRQGWDTLGVEFRTVFDFGVGAIDYRGAYTNEGDTGILGGGL
ncbi:prohead protease/major capsid protein fusion protein [Roseomonas rosulenta]|uniref:prohead protease/major capsid protein fusion protein n=1 Tax=Roseomonas rosulenta TaxID=2748667 RepID=UPI0018DF28AD|nr:prohead protease/major capsid protein fusion protein [Roseomonas rosulenta]